jgi:hypothetical protein
MRSSIVGALAASGWAPERDQARRDPADDPGSPGRRGDNVLPDATAPGPAGDRRQAGRVGLAAKRLQVVPDEDLVEIGVHRWPPALIERCSWEASSI